MCPPNQNRVKNLQPEIIYFVPNKEESIHPYYELIVHNKGFHSCILSFFLFNVKFTMIMFFHSFVRRNKNNHFHALQKVLHTELS